MTDPQPRRIPPSAAYWRPFNFRQGDSNADSSVGRDGYSEEFEIEEGEDYAFFAKDVWDDGNWGDGNYRVEYQWEVTDGDEIVDSGSGFIEHQIEEPPCLEDENGEHDWTSEGEGGLDENPGVWSLGGTTMCFVSHCRTCGLKKTEVNYGSQRNPGQCDTVEYSEPDNDD